MSSRPRAPFYSEIDSQIRAGGLRSARSVLRELLDSPVPREFLSDTAELCRRVGFSEKSLSLLRRYVYPSEAERTTFQATPLEKAEYAGALVRLYAVEEALRLLRTLPDSEPLKHLFTAFARIHEWDYAGAIAPLERFIALEREEYPRLVARVNLATSRVESRDFDRADREIESVLVDCERQGAKRLTANLHETAAQCAFYRGDIRLCESRIRNARALLAESGITVDEFFIEKLERSIALQRKSSTAREFTAFRDRALASGQFEVARDCDRELAVTTKNSSLLEKVWFGTPHLPYRHLLRKDFDMLERPVPSEYRWDLTEGKRRREFDPDLRLKPGFALHRLFLGLTRDFYRPPTLLKLHALVFPDQVFNPRSSPSQIHQLFRRLRSELRKTPLSVTEDQGTYRLHGDASVRLRELPADSPLASSHAAFERLLRSKFTDREFSATEAARSLGISKPTFLARLGPLLRADRIRSIGSGAHRQYLWTPSR